MPWWIWLILALFMIGMIAAGCIYAGIHGLRALQDVGEITSRISEITSTLGNTEDVEENPEDSKPLYTQPISVAQARYRNAHAEIVRRKEAKRDRHAVKWADWTNYNQ